MRIGLALMRPMNKMIGQFAAKGFYPNVGGLVLAMQGIMPSPHNHRSRCRDELGSSLGIGLRIGRHPNKRTGIVDPKPDAVTARGQVGTQAPTDPQISVVVDDAAKNVPKHG